MDISWKTRNSCKKQRFNWRFTVGKMLSLPMVREKSKYRNFMPNLLHFNLKIISAPTHYHDSHKSAKSDHLIGELQWRDCISHTLQGLGGEFANSYIFPTQPLHTCAHFIIDLIRWYPSRGGKVISWGVVSYNNHYWLDTYIHIHM